MFAGCLTNMGKVALEKRCLSGALASQQCALVTWMPTTAWRGPNQHCTHSALSLATPATAGCTTGPAGRIAHDATTRLQNHQLQKAMSKAGPCWPNQCGAFVGAVPQQHQRLGLAMDVAWPLQTKLRLARRLRPPTSKSRELLLNLLAPLRAPPTWLCKSGPKHRVKPRRLSKLQNGRTERPG